jgi:hypothetical protein
LGASCKFAVPQLSADPLGCRSKRGNVMHKLSILLLLGVMSAVAQTSNNFVVTGSDSLSDVFPLTIRNQWTYGYYWEYNDLFHSNPMDHYCDTGTVTIQIIGKIIGIDTTRWTMREESNLCFQYNSGPFSAPQLTIDTFEIIELQQGNHQICRIGDASKISSSIFPFLVTSLNPDDTVQIERYKIVDSVGVARFDFWGDGGFVHSFIFENGKGLNSVITHSTTLSGETWYGNHTLRNSIITSVPHHANDLLPQVLHLEQNYPNPFNPSTTICFSVPLRSFVILKVYDCLGREVSTLISEELAAGKYSHKWNASNFPSGIYFYKLQTSTFTETNKLVLLK